MDHLITISTLDKDTGYYLSSVIKKALSTTGFENVEVFSDLNGEPTIVVEPTLFDVVKAARPDLFKDNISILPIYPVPVEDDDRFSGVINTPDGLIAVSNGGATALNSNANSGAVSAVVAIAEEETKPNDTGNAIIINF